MVGPLDEGKGRKSTHDVRSGSPNVSQPKMMSLLTGRSSRRDESPREVWHVVAMRCVVRDAPDGMEVGCVECGRLVSVDVESSIVSPMAPRLRQQTRGLAWLRVVEPWDGWCNASECLPGDNALLGAQWRFVVVCPEGAFVRDGMELSSGHLYTFPQNSVFEARERRVNEQGLARLRTDEGWISEDLNPLSGQRGPIVLLLPMTRPLAFRVVLDDGAVVRRTVELSSQVVETVASGVVVTVDAKQFSDHPGTHCVPRLRLTHPVEGWISLRLNREPPHDLTIVDLVGVAETPQGDRMSANDPPLVNGDSGDNPPEAVSDAYSSSSCPPGAPTGEMLCLVCLVEMRNATFVHGETGHIACCLKCARALFGRHDPCPVCRMPVDTVIQHFWA